MRTFFFLPNINLRNFMSMKLKVHTTCYLCTFFKYCRTRILCTSTYVLHILVKCVFSIQDTNVLCSFNFKPQSTKVNGRIYFKNDTEDRIFTVFKNSVWPKVMDKTNQIYSSNEIRKTQNEHLNIVCQNLNGL